uniref:META domain-containing protein n=1 Tax=uncultured Draconibacterium sp. TaxID=1573823 RepID=UPI003217B98C
MKKSVFTLCIFALFCFLSSCDKDDECSCSKEIYGKWEAEEFMSVESVLYAKNDDYNPTIEFMHDGTYNLRLDANGCSGSFELEESNSITVSGAGCTEICCDSDFSIKFASTLPQVSTYEIDADELKLNVPGWGWIELERVSD